MGDPKLRGARPTDRRQLPVAVFDSGLGGISVLRCLIAELPGEDYLYFGDSANAPYGTRPLPEVRELTLQNISALYRQGIKAAVIACNTATSAAISELRSQFADIPVIGMEPALKPAVLAHPGGTVLVMATPLTLREEKFSRLLAHYAEQAQIVPMPCPELVEFVESGDLQSDALMRYLHERLDGWRGRADAVVLGCTHFPFLRSAISSVLGAGTVLYDGGAGTARETKRRLTEFGLLSQSAEKGTICLKNSRNDPWETALSRKLLKTL